GGRRGGVLLVAPDEGAVVAAEAVHRAFEAGQVDAVARDHRGGDDLARDGLLPLLPAGLEVEAGQVVFAVALAVGVGHVDLTASVASGRRPRMTPFHPFLPSLLVNATGPSALPAAGRLRFAVVASPLGAGGGCGCWARSGPTASESSRATAARAARRIGSVRR